MIFFQVFFIAPREMTFAGSKTRTVVTVTTGVIIAMLSSMKTAQKEQNLNLHRMTATLASSQANPTAMSKPIS